MALKAFAFLHDNEDHFAFFDHLKTPLEIRFVNGVSKALSITGYEAVLSLEDAVLSASDGIDILFLSGSQVPDESVSDLLISYIKQLAESSKHVILVGSAVTLMAATGLLDGLHVAVGGSIVSSVTKKFPNVRWESRDLYRVGRYWSTPGTLDNLISLALILEASRKGHIAEFYPYEMQNSMKKEDSPTATSASQKKTTPGNKLAKTIVRYRSPSDVMYETLWFTTRLAVEGYLEDASLILKKLCAVIPETYDNIESPSRRGFEFLWHEAGSRPDVPWGNPSAEQLETWANELMPGYPLDTGEKKDVLETLSRRIRLGDTVLRPYSLAIAANLAVECGKEEEARDWLEKQVRFYLEIGVDMNWELIMACRALTPLILSGFVASITGGSVQDASQDSAEVISALEAWSTRRSNLTATNTPLSYDEMLIKLEPRKWASDDSLRFPPASEDAIQAAEARLEIHLPVDYKAFLCVSDGMNFMPSLNLPGLRKVDELQWEEASDIGLDEFRVGLGRQTEEYGHLKRILMVSDKDSEEMVWFVEPSELEKTGEDGWRVVFWTNWMPELQWYASFMDYMVQVMVKDEETGPLEED